jgi:hypothetical protein
MGLPGRGMSNVLCVNIWLSLTKLLAFLMSDIYEKKMEMLIEQPKGSW